MTSFRQIDHEPLVGDPQPLAHVNLDPRALTQRTGIQFDTRSRRSRPAPPRSRRGIGSALRREALRPEPRHGHRDQLLRRRRSRRTGRLITETLGIAETVDAYWDGKAWKERD